MQRFLILCLVLPSIYGQYEIFRDANQSEDAVTSAVLPVEPSRSGADSVDPVDRLDSAPASLAPVVTPAAPPSTPTSVCHLASMIADTCPSTKHEIDSFAYSCFSIKAIPTEDELKTVVSELGMCCRTCPPEGRLPNSECLHNFCDCVDMLNFLHDRRYNECSSQQLKACYKEPTQWASDEDFKKDVGFVQIVQKNVLLGKGGMAFYFVYMIISVLAIIYLTFVCIKYRCVKMQMLEQQAQIQRMQMYAENTDVSTAAALTEPTTTATSTTRPKSTRQSNSVSQTELSTTSLKPDQTNDKEKEPNSVSTTKSVMEMSAKSLKESKSQC